MAIPADRSLISKIVDRDELGKVLKPTDLNDAMPKETISSW